MSILTRGGHTAAAMIERLRHAQQRMTLLEVSLDSLWVCREEDVLAPLLAWSSADTALRPFVDALASPSVSYPDEGLIPRRQPEFFPTPDAQQRVPSPVARLRERSAKTATTAATPEVTQCVTRILAEAKPDAGEFMHSEAIVRHSFRREGLGSAPRRIDGQSEVTLGEAVRWLHSSFAADERLLRAWNHVVARTPASPEVIKLLTEPAAQRVAFIETPPTDPISVRLQPVVDRALRKSLAKTMVNSPGSGMLPGVPTSRETMPPSWDSTASGDRTSRTFGEPPRTSALRRLASYGETIEPERLLVTPAPSTAAPQAAPPRQLRPTIERTNIVQEVTNIFRREALRHGIVPEEETP